MRIRRKKDENPWQEIYAMWMAAPVEKKRAVLAVQYPHLVQMGADASTFDYMITKITPVLQMRAITGMGPEDGDNMGEGVTWDGQHR